LLLDPADPRRLFIRVAYERVYESRDGGQTWQARWDGLGLSTQIISLTMNPARPATLYGGATENFFRSDDGGLHWQSVGPELTGQTVFTIAVDPHDGNILYVGATNGAYRSVDDGEHWERWGQGLEDISVTAFAFDRHDPRLVFAGTKYRGVFRSQDGGQRWQVAGPGPVSINGLLRSADGRWLYAATTAGFYGTEVRP